MIYIVCSIVRVFISIELQLARRVKNRKKTELSSGSILADRDKIGRMLQLILKTDYYEVD
jgi:hypothetical protein